MPVLWIVLIVLLVAAAGYVAGRWRALSAVAGDARLLHSRPHYYGWNVALFAALPALLLLVLWLMAQPVLVEQRIDATIPADAGNRVLVLDQVQRVAADLRAAVVRGTLTADQLVPGSPALGELSLPSDPLVLSAAVETLRLQDAGHRLMTGAVLLLAVAGLFVALARTRADFRSRNVVEHVIRAVLIGCSSIAIATTAGIVLSLLFETLRFFQMYPWQDFLFGTQWTPSFGGDSRLGMLPLLWGTLYISLIALAFAVPVGLYAAIYMSEYASRRVRGIVKPAIEILAGIPTIVYGLFALVTVGPLLRDWIAQPLGWGSSGSSVMTAGLVMGIMLIPFISSLSDDIISAVPQSLRDGSLALGSTPSETIRKVVLPAALPGIVGAILLAASRAIGETMIVVLGAGAMARISPNPFEAMTTITVKIVGQLTGDNDFASPETLVAFALGLTLFVMTLGLNILALYVVRRFREQYE